ncbi:hypothetical protein I4U23_016061 [Adineta vaga]|nr:hypothetical protein I4U23_016061 [Adineta vaga]
MYELLHTLSNSEICSTATWSKTGITVAGGKDSGHELDQLIHPQGIFLGDNDDIYIVDEVNDRIVKWEQNATIGQWIAGVKYPDNDHNSPLFIPYDIIVDKNGTVYITNGGRHQVVRCYQNQDQCDVLIDNIQAVGIAQDNQGYIYISEYADGQITKWNFNDDQFNGDCQWLRKEMLQSACPFLIQLESRPSVPLGSRASRIDSALCSWPTVIDVFVKSASRKLAKEKLTSIKSALLKEAPCAFVYEKTDIDKLA